MLIEPVTLHTADDVALEGELRAPDDAWAAVVLAHPHPQQGGNMRSIVPSSLFDALPAAGVAALRFNFRGVEGSEGSYGNGSDEQLDMVAAIDALAGIAEGLPLALVGWSFGADVSLSVGDERVAAWCAVAAPLRVIPPAEMVAATDPRPKLLVVPEHDQFRPPASAAEATAGWVNTTIEVVAGADHFLVGRVDRVAPLVVELLSRLARG